MKYDDSDSFNTDEISSPANEQPEKLKVKFSIGSESDGRWITFSDNVSLEGIEEWFNFTGKAVVRMFDTGPVRRWHVGFQRADLDLIINKINTIKVVREMTSCGLKCAKDAVEFMFSGTVGLFDSKSDAILACQKLNAACGSQTEIFTISRISSVREQEIINDTGPFSLHELYVRIRKLKCICHHRVFLIV